MGDAAATAAQVEAAQEEDGFEMVEAPDDEGDHSRCGADMALSASTSTLRHQSRAVRERGGLEGEEDGDDDNDNGNGNENDGDDGDEGGLQQLSSPALLALLLVLKSFLKHLSALRRGSQFYEVWRQVRCG